MKRFFALVLCVVTLISFMPLAAMAEKNGEDIVILYENDVHCAVEGYSKLAAMKKELEEDYENVGVVSVGDYVQGSSLGVVSQGEYIVNLMNLVGYDAVTLGNHEFDYRLPRLEELVGMMNTKPVCCNFQKLGEESSYFLPYSIVSYGDVDIAYIGITTPSTISSSFPAQFKDEKGEYLYTFNVNNLYDVVQENIDKAKAGGADYIVALSHIGYAEEGDWEDITDLIGNTEGLDIVLDGHSHSVIENMTLVDEAGNEVVLSSAGTKFQHIGKLTISENNITTELIATENYDKTDNEVDEYIKKINEEYALLGDRKVAVSNVHLITHDNNGNRLVRNSETNLGDLCADAFRIVTGADIGFTNGGGIRADIKAGNVTFNDVLSVFPFNNQVVVAEVSGQVIKDLLETAVKSYPAEDGTFPHLSGITFSVNTSIPSSVTLDENEMFTGVSGTYRVYDIKVLNSKTGVYEVIDLEKTYSFASIGYYVFEFGGGLSMFKDAKILQNDGMLDAELLERYIVENLGGVIGEEYAEMMPNITFTDGENSTEQEIPETGDNSDYMIAVMIVTVLLGATILNKTKEKNYKGDFL
ncbi:MAG: bifunctional metallophosphatase/5'-nucleotidase [Clostridia bacterium]|nr:bifunctional metallophosphatase/5'-nucleotidase [Clostridia bacterium]